VVSISLISFLNTWVWNIYGTLYQFYFFETCDSSAQDCPLSLQLLYYMNHTVLLPTHILPLQYTKLHVKSPVPVLGLSFDSLALQQGSYVCMHVYLHFVLWYFYFSFFASQSISAWAPRISYLFMNSYLSTLPSCCLALPIHSLNLGFPQVYTYNPLVCKILWFAKMNTYLSVKNVNFEFFVLNI